MFYFLSQIYDFIWEAFTHSSYVFIYFVFFLLCFIWAVSQQEVNIKTVINLKTDKQQTSDISLLWKWNRINVVSTRTNPATVPQVPRVTNLCIFEIKG